MTLRHNWCLLSALGGLVLTGFYGCQGPGGIGGAPDNGGESLTMAAPTPTPPFKAGVNLFTYILTCQGDPAGSHKQIPAASDDIVFNDIKVGQGASCKLQMAADISKVSSEYKFNGVLVDGQTVVYEGTGLTKAASGGRSGLDLDVTLGSTYGQLEGSSRPAVIPFTVSQGDSNLFPKNFKLVCGMIENSGACYKDAIKNQVKCESVSTKAQADCILKATSEDGKASFESKSFSIPEGKAATDTVVGSVELLQASQTSGPLKVNATIQQRPN